MTLSRLVSASAGSLLITCLMASAGLAATIDLKNGRSIQASKVMPTATDLIVFYDEFHMERLSSDTVIGVDGLAYDVFLERYNGKLYDSSHPDRPLRLEAGTNLSDTKGRTR